MVHTFENNLSTPSPVVIERLPPFFSSSWELQQLYINPQTHCMTKCTETILCFLIFIELFEKLYFKLHALKHALKHNASFVFCSLNFCTTSFWSIVKTTLFTFAPWTYHKCNKEKEMYWGYSGCGRPWFYYYWASHQLAWCYPHGTWFFFSLLYSLESAVIWMNIFMW